MAETECEPIDPDQPAFLRLPVKCIPTVVAALKNNGFKSEAASVLEFTSSYTDPTKNAERLKWLALAEEQVARDGEIEFDSDSTFSDSIDNGQYVLGWVWVDGPDEEEEDELLEPGDSPDDADDPVSVCRSGGLG